MGDHAPRFAPCPPSLHVLVKPSPQATRGLLGLTRARVRACGSWSSPPPEAYAPGRERQYGTLLILQVCAFAVAPDSAASGAVREHVNIPGGHSISPN